MTGMSRCSEATLVLQVHGEGVAEGDYVAFWLELERLLPNLRVPPQSGAAYHDMTTLGYEIIGNNCVGSTQVWRSKIPKWMKAKRFPYTCVKVDLAFLLIPIPPHLMDCPQFLSLVPAKHTYENVNNGLPSISLSLIRTSRISCCSVFIPLFHILILASTSGSWCFLTPFTAFLRAFLWPSKSNILSQEVSPRRPHIHYSATCGVSTLIVDVTYEVVGFRSPLVGQPVKRVGREHMRGDFGVHLLHEIDHPPENRLVSKHLRETSHYRPWLGAWREWELLSSFLVT
nr:hypothetical protein Iba_chr04fCG6630 [Ipomoea batatas]